MRSSIRSWILSRGVLPIVFAWVSVSCVHLPSENLSTTSDEKNLAAVRCPVRAVSKNRPAVNDAVAEVVGRVGIAVDSALPITVDRVERSLRSAVGFLIENFGPPKYTGRLQVDVRPQAKHSTSYPGSSRNRIRRIEIGGAVLIESEQHILVHELFHALYQDEDLLDSTPLFFVEGLSVYAEWLFRYGEKNGAELKNSAKKTYEVSRCEEDILAIVESNKPPTKCHDRYYAAAGLFFSLQDHCSDPLLIERIVRFVPRRKLTLDTWPRYYGLEWPEELKVLLNGGGTSKTFGPPPERRE